MLQTMTLLPISLILFDGGEGGATGAASNGGYGSAPDAGGLSGGPNEAGQAPDAGEESPEARFERYKAAREEFKDLYDKDTQKILSRRLKEAGELRSQLDAVGPVMDTLFTKYGVEPGDVDALEAAINDDTAFWEEAAEERGMTVEQYKDFARMERELQAYRAEKDRAMGEQMANETLQRWYMEGEALKAEYPKFDLEAESGNPEFVSLLRSGVPVKTAFELVHLEDIKAGVAASTAKAAEKQITANIKARGARPSEAGSKSGVSTKIDVSKLDKKGRAELIARAAKGEIISF